MQTFEVAVRRCARQNRDSLDCQFVVVVVDGFLPRFWLFFFFWRTNSTCNFTQRTVCHADSVSCLLGLPSAALSEGDVFTASFIEEATFFFFLYVCVLRRHRVNDATCITSGQQDAPKGFEGVAFAGGIAPSQGVLPSEATTAAERKTTCADYEHMCMLCGSPVLLRYFRFAHKHTRSFWFSD